MNSPYMPWIDHLPEVGEPITKERDKLAEKLAEARRLELRAEALRADVIRESTSLFDRVARQWSGQDIAKAHAKADAAESALTPRFVADPALREQLLDLAGHASPMAILRVFKAQAFRQHNLLSTATDGERRDTLERVLDWWNFGARLVLEGAES